MKSGLFAKTFLLALAFGLIGGLTDLRAALPEASPAAAPTPAGAPTLHDALRALVLQIGDLDQQIAKVNEAISATPSEELRSRHVSELRQLHKQRSQARLDLLDIISNADLSSLQKVEEKPFSLQGALEDLIKPLVEEGRRATAGSRERRDLEDRFNHANAETTILRSALDSLDQTIQQTPEPDVLALLTGIRAEYGKRYDDSSSELRVLTYRLGEIQKKKHLLVDETADVVMTFFRERGKNLLVAILAAAAVGISLRVIHLALHRHTSVFRRGRSQAARLLDVVLYLLTGFGALVAAVIVLLNAGDWVLLGFVVIFVLALIFMAKDALSSYVDQFRVMLNYGSVREGERIVFNGVPWLVENLTFFTTLRNPLLHGGMVRLPLAMLPAMLSRPPADDEPYFPSGEGDWVLLDDDTFGHVVFQSVEMVRLQLVGGTLKMIPTPAYLGQNPRNLSHGFRVMTTIGIDYAHQPAATGQILTDLNQFFGEEVTKLVPPEAIRSLKIEFALANTSTLDYQVLLDLDGSVAREYFILHRALQRLTVDASNRFGLTLPFQQVTLHQTDPAPR